MSDSGGRVFIKDGVKDSAVLPQVVLSVSVS